MVCLPVRGDSPRALASRLSYVQVDKHGITIVSVDLVHHQIFHAKVGIGPIKLPTIKSSWSIVYNEGSQVIISKAHCSSSSED